MFLGSFSLLFLASIVGFSFVSRQFFRPPPGRSFWSKCDCPPGSAFKTTAKAVEEVERFCKADKEVATYTSYIGSGCAPVVLPMAPELHDISYGVIVLNTADAASRDRVRPASKPLPPREGFVGCA